MKELDDFFRDVREADDEEKDYWWIVPAIVALLFVIIVGTLSMKFFYGKLVPEAHASTCTTIQDCCSEEIFTNDPLCL